MLRGSSFFFQGALRPTICQHCGWRDSLRHLAERVNRGAAPLHDRDDLALFLAELSRRAHNVNPRFPAPPLQGDGADAGLQIWSDSECGEGEEGEPQLDFDDDVGIERAPLCGNTGDKDGGSYSCHWEDPLPSTSLGG